MKIKSKNNGITLIALVISIIVMLILVAVSISMVVNGGLLKYAGEAVSNTQDVADAEQELSNGRINIDGKQYKSIDDYIAGKVELPKELKVGDYVNYTPTSGEYEITSMVSGYGTISIPQTFKTETGDSALKWRVWSIDEEEGVLELISATTAQTEKKLYLEGAEGYNHAVDILNDLCKELYSNEKGAIARSIKVEDINAKTTFVYREYKNYGKVYTPNHKEYPKIYEDELGSTENGVEERKTMLEGSDGVRKADGTADYEKYTGISTADKLYATKTYYGYIPEDYLDNELGVNVAPKGLIDSGEMYYLASRCVYADDEYAHCGMRVLGSDYGKLDYEILFSTTKLQYARGFSVRPIVSLKSSVSLTLDEKNTSKDETYWNITF